MDRQIDFSRSRHMLCGQCGYRCVADLEWIDRFERRLEHCPGCGVTCEAEDAPRVTVDPEDLALSGASIVRFAWYHTSTRQGWPAKHFDPAAELTEETRLRMERACGGGSDSGWAERQRAKALHIGTYEAAVHSMLRRIQDQDDHGRQFYLYRVRLVPSITVREDWIPDSSDCIGDVILNDVCPPGVDAARYLNDHEDPGGLSLALGRTAIASTQQIAIPRLAEDDHSWVCSARDELERAATLPPVPDIPDLMGRARWRSPLIDAARALASALAQRLPVNLREQFESAAAFGGNMQPDEWARYVQGLLDVILSPEQVLNELDRAPVRVV